MPVVPLVPPPPPPLGIGDFGYAERLS